MSVEQVLYILIACNAGLLGMFIAHLAKCRDTRVDIAVIKATLERIEKAQEHEFSALWNQVGRDSFSGMRKTVHAVEGTPSAIMDLDRRVDRLEQK